MATLTLTSAQIADLIMQLSSDQKRAVLRTLAEDARTRREANTDYAEAQLRQLSAQRGLDWDMMSESQREQFVDDLVHEDRGCRR